ncbi:MAG TPA: transglycosylase domain-containing protein, partial [Dehalococcoidia bacterium]
FVGLVITGIIVYNSYANDLVPPDELAINEPSFGAKILDRNGKLLYEYVDDRAGLRRPVPLENVAPAFLAATIATEDNSFFTNPGINLKGLIRAGWENTLGGSVFEGSGGSSITQQLVKNVYIPVEARQERFSSEGIDRKLKETVYAIELTQRYSKEQVLEWYVNQISYGGVYNGVEAAAQGYFGKPAKDLTLAEAALLAGIPQCPSCYDPVNDPEAATERRNQILDIMANHGRTQIGEDAFFEPTPEEIAAAKAEPIAISEKRFPIEAPHFVLQYVQPLLEALPRIGREAIFRDGLVVTTTLDLDMQQQFQQIMENRITAPVSPGSSQTFEELSNSHNGSMMEIDPKTGEIIVMVGSRDYWNEDIQGKNNNATACNSPGSSFKPFAYITTFEKLGWGPSTLILDTPVIYKDDTHGDFLPKDPIPSTMKPMTIRNALGNSMNIPANKAAAAVGADQIVETAKRVGFAETFRYGTGGCSTGFGYGPAIATGGVDVTLEEMMFGYSVLANAGIMRGVEPIIPHPKGERDIDPVAILKITDAAGETRYDVEEHRKQKRVIDAEYTYLIWDIVTDSSSQCLTFGCGGITINSYKTGVKTGTSEPFNRGDRCAGLIGETWAFGYSPDLVVGIWAGNSDNDCVQHIYSTSISWRSVNDAVKAAHANLPTTAMERPPGIVEAEVCVPSGLLPSPLCGQTTKGLFAKQKLPSEQDTWWQNVTIDTRTGLVATSTTPSQYRRTQVALVPPESLLQTDEDKSAWEEWAKELNVPLAGQGVGLGVAGAGDPNGSAVLLLPRNGQNVSGVVQILGRAVSPDFQLYKLEYGAGANPTKWTTILANPNPIETGTIGAWNTDGLPDGDYTLRLVVQDARRGDQAASVVIKIGKGASAAPTPVGTPRLAP